MRHKSPLMQRRVAMEVIDFQTDKFGIELETIISTVCNKIKNIRYEDARVIEDTDEIIQLSKLIFNRTGLKIRFVTGLDDAMVMVFHTNVHGIFASDPESLQFKNDRQAAMLKTFNGKKGTIDLKKAKVSGIFSEYDSKLYLNFYLLVAKYKLSPSEITAIILHELGHLFYTYEYADRLETTNQILANVSKELLSDKKEKNLKYIYTELKSIKQDLKESDVDVLVNGRRTIAGYFLFKTIIGSINSQSGARHYDKTSAEQLADNFASRFNYGRQLISALEKLDTDNTLEKSQNFEIFNALLMTIRFAIITAIRIGGLRTLYPILSRLSPFIMGFMMGNLVFQITLSIGMVILNTVFAGESKKNYTYDDLKIRYQRIRNDYIESLKNLDLSNSDLKKIIQDVDYMDKIIKETYQYKSIYDLLANILFSSDRQALKETKEQQLLERLVSNDLFLQSAHFKTLA